MKRVSGDLGNTHILEGPCGRVGVVCRKHVWNVIVTGGGKTYSTAPHSYFNGFLDVAITIPRESTGIARSAGPPPPAQIHFGSLKRMCQGSPALPRSVLNHDPQWFSSKNLVYRKGYITA